MTDASGGFPGRIIAVTGAALGFGRAVAQGFSAGGAQVFAAGLAGFVPGQMLPVHGGSFR